MQVEVKTSAKTPAPTKKPRRFRRNALYLIGILVLLGLAYGYAKAEQRVQELENRPVESSQEEATAIIEAVSKHFRLPDEKPTIATVEDEKKLEGQSFFAHAKKGDKVLMFTESKKAILYRPSTDTIIEVAYLNISR